MRDTDKIVEYCREKFPDLTQDEEAAIRRNAIGKGVLFLRCKFVPTEAKGEGG